MLAGDGLVNESGFPQKLDDLTGHGKVMECDKIVKRSCNCVQSILP